MVLHLVLAEYELRYKLCVYSSRLEAQAVTRILEVETAGFVRFTGDEGRAKYVMRRSFAHASA